MNTFSTARFLCNSARATVATILLTMLRLGWAQQDQQRLPKGLVLDTPAISSSRLARESLRENIFEETFDTEAPGWIMTGGWSAGKFITKSNNSLSNKSMAASNSSASYSNDADAWLVSPRLSLFSSQPGTRFTLRLHEWFELESGYDFGYVKVSPDDGISWITVSVRDGKNDGREHEIDITSFTDQEIRIAFHLVSDASNVYAGWHLSYLAIERATSAALDATLRTLNSRNFPFIYMNVEVTGESLPILPQDNFVVRENGVIQTDLFSVIPPDTSAGLRLADIIFLIDDTGSMANEIAAVRDNVNAFLTALQTRSINYALGLVTFKDNVTLYNSGILTQNVTLYRSWIDALFASGGGDGPENSFGGLNVALSSFSFRPGAQKVFILITDAPSHVPPAPSHVIPPPPSLSQINNSMNNASVNCYAVAIETAQYAGTGSITDATGGRFFNVTSPFNAILDDITNIVAETYIVSYRSSNPSCDGLTRNVDVTVTHAGESATASGSYIPCAAPRIQRTPATINLSNSAQVAGINLTIAAEITDPVAPFVQSATLFYRTTGAASYVSKPMTISSGNIYQAVIFGSSVQTPGIDYYITATDGQVTSSDPAVDSDTVPYQIAVTPNQPPQIVHTPVMESPKNTDITITADVTDNTNFLSSVTLYYRRFGALLFSSATMNLIGGSTHQATIPGSAMTDDGVEYYIRAVDDFGVASVHGIHFIAPPPPPSPCAFTDDFNDGNANGWIPLTPSRWQVGNDAGSLRYFLNTTDYNSPDDKRLGELSILSSQTWSNFVFECDAKSEDAAFGSSGADLSVVFGYQDFDSYYYVNYNREAGFTEMHRIHDGGPRVTLATYDQPTFDDGNYHKLKVERTGDQLRAYFDDALILSASDSFFGQGQIGVGSFNDSGFFDNIVITGCAVDGELPNLTGTALAFSPSSFCPGDAINITGNVINNGDGPASNDIRANFYLTDIPGEPDYSLFVHSFVIPPLNAGQSFSFSESGAIPAATLPGAYYLWMNVDVDDHNIESNEDDNGIRTNAQLAVTVPCPASATIKPVVPNPATNCADYTVDIRVDNVTNLFGVSFELNYTNTVYVEYISSENGEFLGNDVVFFANADDLNGKISMGITRKTGQPGSTGSGVVARVKFASPETTPPGTPVTFSITNVAANDPSGSPITLTALDTNTVLNCGIVVWPGDTNNDGTVNQADVLPLGLHWSRTGSSRSDGSCNWSAQLVTPWTPEAATYADANGDGIVNQADVLCIGLNWNRTHSVASSALSSAPADALAKPSSASVSAEVNAAELVPGQEFVMRILAAEAANLIGLAFELQNDQPGLLQILAVEPEALFGQEALLYAHLDGSGKTGVGIARKDQRAGTQREGAVIRIKFKISSEAQIGQVVNLTLDDVVAQDQDGHIEILSSSSLQLNVGGGSNVALMRSSRTVTAYQLYQNFPNPFNPETMIEYDILQAGHVTLIIYNAMGQKVRTLIEEPQAAGAYQIRWDGRNAQGQALPSGIYFYRLHAGEFVQIRKMTLVQ